MIPKKILKLSSKWSLAASFTLALTLGLLAPSHAMADNWKSDLKDTDLPSHFVAVDKKNKKFFFYEKNSPLRLTYEFSCTTGRLPGDKQVVNDLKTPEGIYFVKSKIDQGLDFKEYGGVAYTLNYPNPVDRLRGKTGYNIWIHSKGYGLVPTRGCVAIDLKDIDTVGPKLTPGTAVIVAEEMQVTEPLTPSTEASELKELMEAWSLAWSERSEAMFDFYDPAAYSKSTENFELFKANKERVFKSISSIQLYHRGIHVLEGPGYWVTWAEQYYATAKHQSEGIRRLYWQKDAQDKFKIVGMEWAPLELGFKQDIAAGRLVALARSSVSDATWPENSKPEAKLTEPKASSSSLQAKPNNEQLLFLANQNLISPPEFTWHTEESDGAETGQTSTNLLGQNLNPRELLVKTDPFSDVPKEEIDKIILTQSTRFFTTISQKNPDYEQFFYHEKFNRVPKVPKQRSLKSILRDFEKLRQEAWLTLISREPVLGEKQEALESRVEVLLVTPEGLTEGEYRLFWNKDEEGFFKLIGLTFHPRACGLIASYLEQITPAIQSMVDKWAKAWSEADLEGYLSCYTEKAVQQGRRGLAAIRRQKEKLWAESKPGTINFTGLRVMYQKSRFCVDMEQTYKSEEKTERGLKILYVEYDGTNWRINEEDWRALPKLNN